jgi:hypothetical protein
MGQTLWLLPVLHGDVHGQAPVQTWAWVDFPGQVAGTLLVTVGLLVGTTLLVALGAVLNLTAAALVMARSLRLWWAQPAMVER